MRLMVLHAPSLTLESKSTIIRFLESCSWIRMTFSTPLTTKYPPGSSGHSVSLDNSWIVTTGETYEFHHSLNTNLFRFFQKTNLWTFPGKDAVGTAQHNGHSANGKIIAHDALVPLNDKSEEITSIGCLECVIAQKIYQPTIFKSMSHLVCIRHRR